MNARKKISLDLSEVTQILRKGLEDLERDLAAKVEELREIGRRREERMGTDINRKIAERFDRLVTRGGFRERHAQRKRGAAAVGEPVADGGEKLGGSGDLDRTVELTDKTEETTLVASGGKMPSIDTLSINDEDGGGEMPYEEAALADDEDGCGEMPHEEAALADDEDGGGEMLRVKDVQNDPELNGGILLKLLYGGGVLMALFNLGVSIDLLPKCVRYIKRAFDGTTLIDTEPIPRSRDSVLYGKPGSRRSSVMMAMDAVNPVAGKGRRSSLATIMGLNAIDDVLRTEKETKAKRHSAPAPALSGVLEEDDDLDEDDMAALNRTISSISAGKKSQ